jgi:hypothetical protein
MTLRGAIGVAAAAELAAVSRETIRSAMNEGKLRFKFRGPGRSRYTYARWLREWHHGC